HGVTRGDRVALLCSNRAEFMEIVLGCAWLGAVVVPINTASRGLQLEHILQNYGARLLVAESHLVGAVAALDPQALALERIWLIGETSAETPLPSQWESMPLPPPGAACEAAALADGDPLAILYTSGTSGLSKGVICPHAQFYWWGHYTGRHLGVTAGDVLYT